mmetsp:Transcript_30547/g.71265  ORF Transcript_30547/g.71265 Transcript_30547/m.71265 type:complete len:331 (+) Transcript_30547:209-1201(+)
MCHTTGLKSLQDAAAAGALWLASQQAQAPAARQRATQKDKGRPEPGRVIFPRHKGDDEDEAHARPVRVSRKMLDSLTHLPLPCACKKLGLCATTFKKACRRMGIMQWPFKRGCALSNESHRAHAASCAVAEKIEQADESEPETETVRSFKDPAAVKQEEIYDSEEVAQLQCDAPRQAVFFGSAPSSPCTSASSSPSSGRSSSPVSWATSSEVQRSSPTDSSLSPAECLLEPLPAVVPSKEEEEHADFLAQVFAGNEPAFLAEDAHGCNGRPGVLGEQVMMEPEFFADASGQDAFACGYGSGFGGGDRAGAAFMPYDDAPFLCMLGWDIPM